MPGLDPGIHAFLCGQDVDGRDEPGHDGYAGQIAPPARLIAGVALIADISGALFWDEQSLLVVSDLHLEKGSSFAARGMLLPPYDTVATLAGSPP